MLLLLALAATAIAAPLASEDGYETIGASPTYDHQTKTYKSQFKPYTNEK